MTRQQLLALAKADPLNAGFYAFQYRLGSRELRAPQLDDRFCDLYGIPRQVVQREAFAGDRPTILDGFQGETIRYWDTGK